jgi:streptogramin lyase
MSKNVLIIIVFSVVLVGCGQSAAQDGTSSLATATAEESRVPAPDVAGEAGATAVAATVLSPTAMPAGDENGQAVPLAEDDGPLPAVVPEPSPAVAGQEAGSAPVPPFEPELQEYPVPPGSHPHDVAPAPDGSVWYTAQHLGALGRLDPATGETQHIPLGSGSAPHGVIVGPDGAAWVTDSGLNAIVRVDPESEAVESFPLPAGTGYANLNTATFDNHGVLWFTGQSGFYGRLDPASGEI